MKKIIFFLSLISYDYIYPKISFHCCIITDKNLLHTLLGEGGGGQTSNIYLVDLLLHFFVYQNNIHLMTIFQLKKQFKQ